MYMKKILTCDSFIVLKQREQPELQCWWQNFLAIGRTFCPMAELLAEPLPVS